MDYQEFCDNWIPLGDGLLAMARGILGSSQDAEDALQDLYIKLWSQRETLDKIYNPAGYASRVLKNLCIDRLRTAHPMDEIPEDLLGFESADAQIENAELIKATASVITKLPDTQRRVLEMRALQGLSYDEMSQVTGMSKLTLRVLLSRARAAIRKNV